MRFGFARGLACAFATVALAASGAAVADTSAAEAAAQAALLPLKQALKGALEKALSEGPIAAVDACRLEAPRITQASAGPGLRVGRTSDRLRNPANAPAAWLKPLLDEYAKAGPAATGGRLVDLGSEGIGYVEPITLQPPCMVCHGSQLAPELLTHIRDRYPEDRAIGYELDDFRGLFWVLIER